MLSKRPKSTLETLALDALEFLPKFQLRDGLPEGVTYDEATVSEYVSRLENGAEFKPLEAVAVAVVKGGKKKVRHLVFSGFNRGEAFRRHGVNSVRVLVYPGTEEDALYYALTANSDESALPRTRADKHKAFYTLLDTPALKQRAMDAGKGTVGIQRAFALACGISHGLVAELLKARGLHATRDGRLEPIPQPCLSDGAPDPGDPPALAHSGEADGGDGDGGDEPEPAGPPTVEMEDVREMATKDAIHTAIADVRSLMARAETLLKGPLADVLRGAAAAHGLPLAVKERERNADINDIALVKVEYWPALTALASVFADVQAAAHGTGRGAA